MLLSKYEKKNIYTLSDLQISKSLTSLTLSTINHSVFHYLFQITNSQTVRDNTNNNDINSNESNENNESRNQNPKTQIEQEFGFKANQNQNENKTNDLPKFNKYNKNDPRIERATFHLLGERYNH